MKQTGKLLATRIKSDPSYKSVDDLRLIERRPNGSDHMHLIADGQHPLRQP